jgi:hypothetical protein
LRDGDLGFDQSRELSPPVRSKRQRETASLSSLALAELSELSSCGERAPQWGKRALPGRRLILALLRLYPSKGGKSIAGSAGFRPFSGADTHL